MKRLLVDTQTFSLTKAQINESLANNNGRLIVTGVLQRAEAQNQNGRVYPKKLLEREVSKYKKREIKENRAYGELDHPDSSVVELKNTSHIVRDVWWNGNDVMGKVEVLKTPAGNIISELLKAGCTVGISSRGMGSIKEMKNGAVMVEDDFDLVCWDFVSNPSTHGAFMRPLSESVNKNTIKSYKKINNIIRDIICEIDGVCSLK
tara:strand:+ start:2905 stop:3519 length:615 start_codon:yes stop_codon:yes gene_type:complete